MRGLLLWALTLTLIIGGLIGLALTGQLTP
jgi:hypothetical protein